MKSIIYMESGPASAGSGFFIRKVIQSGYFFTKW
jgi:hypothetical protein